MANLNTDYQALINQSVASGNFQAAAQYERLRNEKIADPNYTGKQSPTNIWQMYDASNQISELKGLAQSNNAASAEQAQIQRDWQEAQNAKAMEFNASEAAKNRDWQEMMSNTAHQREVKDLMAAGLNPVLSAMNGNGAAVTSGATASGVTSAGAKGEIDTATSGAIANILGSLLAANTQIMAQNINARTQEAVADKYTAMEKIVSEINAAANIQSAGIHANATKYAAEAAQLASILNTVGVTSAQRYSSDNSKEAQKYSADSSKEAQKYSADSSKEAQDFRTKVDLGLGIGNIVASLFGSVMRRGY